MRDGTLLWRVFAEPDAVTKGVNHLTTLGLPRRVFQPRAVVPVVLPQDFAVKFFNPQHLDRDG